MRCQTRSLVGKSNGTPTEQFRFIRPYGENLVVEVTFMCGVASYNGARKTTIKSSMRLPLFTSNHKEVTTMSKKTVTVARSAISGKFVKAATAVRHPRTTIVQTVKKKYSA